MMYKSRKSLAEIFDCDKSTIRRKEKGIRNHINDVYPETVVTVSPLRIRLDAMQHYMMYGEKIENGEPFPEYRGSV